MNVTRTVSESNLEAILAEAQQLQRDRPVLTRLHLVLPVVLLATAGLLLWAFGVHVRVAKASVVAFLTIGKLIIVSGSVPALWQMSALELALMVFALDVWVAYLFAYNLHHVYRVPRMGPWLERLQNYCRYWLAKQPWMKKWAFTGVALFVMFPLTGTGAPGGSLLGRIAGLRPGVTLLAIVTGSALGCTLMAAFAARLEPVFHDMQQEWWFRTSGLLVLAILLWLLVRLGRRLSRAADDYARSTESGG